MECLVSMDEIVFVLDSMVLYSLDETIPRQTSYIVGNEAIEVPIQAV